MTVKEVEEVKYDGKVIYRIVSPRDPESELQTDLSRKEALEIADDLALTTKIHLRENEPGLFALFVECLGMSAREYIPNAELVDYIENHSIYGSKELDAHDHSIWALVQRRGILDRVFPGLQPPKGLEDVLGNPEEMAVLLSQVKGSEVKPWYG